MGTRNIISPKTTVITICPILVIQKHLKKESKPNKKEVWQPTKKCDEGLGNAGVWWRKNIHSKMYEPQAIWILVRNFINDCSWF